MAAQHMACSLFYITAKDPVEARAIGKVLVEERIVACANIVDRLQSLYRWEEKIVEDNETALIVKTRSDFSERLMNRVKELHSYTCPCIVELPIKSGNPDYLEWILKATEPHGK